MINTFHELGGAVGLAVLSTIAAPILTADGPSYTGITRAFTLRAFAAVAAGLLAAIVPAGRPLTPSTAGHSCQP